MIEVHFSCCAKRPWERCCMLLRLKGEESMRRKRHVPIPPEALDEPFGPPPEAYLCRCPVCDEEMLVNEAIMDVAIGAAKFRGE